MSASLQFKSIYLAKRNPCVKAEDWPRTWRSHAAYAAQFPVIYADFSSIYYCARVLQPSSNGALIDPAKASRDYDGVALVRVRPPMACPVNFRPTWPRK